MLIEPPTVSVGSESYCHLDEERGEICYVTAD